MLLIGINIGQDKVFRDRTVLERPTFPVADIQTGYGLALFDSYYEGRANTVLSLRFAVTLITVRKQS